MSTVLVAQETRTLVEAWQPAVDPHHTRLDKLVLEALAAEARDLPQPNVLSSSDSRASQRTVDKALTTLAALNDPASSSFDPTVFTSFDNDQIPLQLRPLIDAYSRWAQRIVRKPTDVVFVTHAIIYLTTLLPSALWLLFVRFNYLHGVAHTVYAVYCAGAFTLLMHNHLHNNGLLVRRLPWSVVDQIVPYVLYPLMGHTWNTYFYHHKQMHHVEGNGPADLSSTVRYQRDSPYDFLCYVTRFMFLIWAELPYYFWNTKRKSFAIRVAFWELSTYAMLVCAASYNLKAATFTLLIPLAIMRIGLMVGNWGQHALIDEHDPTSDFRSSITLIDIASNRYCFNDGYHTSHHLNPRLHWREHPRSFLKRRQEYADYEALTFYGIDYLMITVRLLCKDYEYLAGRLVPMGKQHDMTLQDKVELLKRKTKRFTEEDLKRIFGSTESVMKREGKKEA